MWLPFSPFARDPGFQPLPFLYWPLVATMLIAYLSLTYWIKSWLHRRHHAQVCCADSVPRSIAGRIISPMNDVDGTLLGFAAALGAGLLIGIERERRKGKGPHRAPAGVRTFALASLAGAGAAALQQPLLVAAGAALITVLAGVAYWRDRSRDPGVTTEIALLVTYLLGVLAIEHPLITAGGSVVVTMLLVSRSTLHDFSVDVLTETELRDGLLFAAAALILLPLLPNATIPWVAGANPRRLWGLVVLFMAIQAAGYVALRVVGVRFGLALSGLASGFVSSTGTIAALGARAREYPALLTACVSGALFSTVATIVLLGIVVVTVYSPALAGLAPSLLAALLAAAGAASFSLWRQRGSAKPLPGSGHAFNFLYALGFAAGLALATAAVSLAARYLGATAAAVMTAVASIFDVHAAATSTLSMAAAGKISTADARLPVLIALSTNAFAKLIAAFTAGGRAFGVQVGVGLALSILAAWLPLLIIR